MIYLSSQEGKSIIVFRVNSWEAWVFNGAKRNEEFSSVTQSCLTLCDLINRSTPGLPVHHQLPESTPTHLHPCHSPMSPISNVKPFTATVIVMVVFCILVKNGRTEI